MYISSMKPLKLVTDRIRTYMQQRIILCSCKADLNNCDSIKALGLILRPSDAFLRTSKEVVLVHCRYCRHHDACLEIAQLQTSSRCLRMPFDSLKTKAKNSSNLMENLLLPAILCVVKYIAVAKAIIFRNAGMLKMDNCCSFLRFFKCQKYLTYPQHQSERVIFAVAALQTSNRQNQKVTFGHADRDLDEEPASPDQMHACHCMSVMQLKYSVAGMTDMQA